MTSTQNIQVTLLKMAELLRLGGLFEWVSAFEKYYNDIVFNPIVAKGKILSMYGGMGSLNDLILYREGILLIQENSEFDILRSQLYTLCHT